MKLFVTTKVNLIIYFMIFVLLSGLVLFNRDAVAEVFENAAPKRDLPIYCVDRGDEKICSVSFDAAWGNEDTEELIAILEKYNVKATFFVVGDWVDKYPQSVKQLADAGHEVMNHSNKHPHMTKLSEDEIKKEINSCSDKIEAITGRRPILFRPPYGDYNDRVVSGARNIGHYTIQWDVDSLDWKDLEPDAIYERVVKRVSPGSIVLFHNAAKNTPAALPKIFEKLIADGYSFVPISELIYKDNFEIDHAGRQI
jgi:polysaccharide deacetylase family sporulation protein PdaB